MLFDMITDALMWALLPKSTVGFLLRCAVVVGVVVAVQEFT